MHTAVHLNLDAKRRRHARIHTCPGGDCDSTQSGDVDYADLLPSMFKMNAGYFLIQLASEADKERVTTTSSTASSAIGSTPGPSNVRGNACTASHSWPAACSVNPHMRPHLSSDVRRCASTHSSS
jgi:hypothetical protein